ncbi:prolyl oligopeptidase family serine peptidase [Luteibacter aegosomatis]|uniref:prolyl oligopeptidase family serine peptidase n=1 Tax=Luteibacter aegosomatis TaxID=2911537 RepID=UPI001FFB4CB3|nr:prolyl oligopeptidase family serine peptidase [Luteibacter aegosomatis]UPG86325.1 prolyl oligopeptidase family serine peptidase [Luteibacter aegosomatis]
MHHRWIALAIALTLSGMTQAHDLPKTPAPAAQAAGDDENLWLDDIDGAKPLAWVKAENAKTVEKYAQGDDFKTLDARILEMLDSDAKIPMVSKIGDRYYNLWRDKDHPKGLWRRTTLAEYRKDKPAWETVIDLDALSASEKENWVWHGATCLKPEYRRCLVSLSRGGADADVVREFDLTTKTFVKDGFTLPEAKSQVAWIDDDHLYVATDFGPGSMTDSSYPRIVKEWKRGTPLSSATTVYEGKHDDMAISAFRDRTPGFERDFVQRAMDFYTSQTFLRGKDGKLTKIDVPDDAITDVEREWLLIELRTDWTAGGTTYASGSLLAAKFDDYMAGKRELLPLFTPDAHTSLAGYSWTRHHLFLNLMHDVVSEVRVLTPADKGAWKSDALGGAPALSAMQAIGIDADDGDDYFLTVTGFLQPTTLYYGTLGHEGRDALKHTPTFFDASNYAVTQHFATSKDGTKVPYFEIAPKSLKTDGSNPTLVYGYGGFEISLQPAYAASAGRAWLEKGGVYVVANIRGGGEYGPRWHQAAMKANRPRAYEDFAAVSQDLIDRKITSPKHMGMMGGSNGGLLAGNMLTQYPQLYGAVVSQVALLDMKRYPHMSAGASWMAEYGNPDNPEEWKFIQTFSPYHNLHKGTAYPPVLFTTSTRDDRVGPVHARKMAARMQAMGLDASFYENMEGGHGAAADNKQSAFMSALAYVWLWDHLK